MSRSRQASKLQLLARLARHEESRALIELAQKRTQVVRLEEGLAQLRSQTASTQQRLAGDRLRRAAELAADQNSMAALRAKAAGLALEHRDACRLESEARESVARARLRVRAIENAIERREARARVERNRRETRRIDEAVRERRAREEDADAFC